MMNNEENNNLGIKTDDPNAIVFSFTEPPEEIMRINKEGFFWRGKLIENDKEIYEKFKEWLTTANELSKENQLSSNELDVIEENYNLVNLLKTTLEFYADERNYIGPMGNIAPIDLDEHGFQARFALEKVKELEEQNKKMLEDYDKILAGYEQLQALQSNVDPEELIKALKLLNDDKNI